MSPVALTPSLTPTQTRHPELVSGSIAPPTRSVLPQASRAAVLPNGPSARAEKWTLKRVQGDEFLFYGIAA